MPGSIPGSPTSYSPNYSPAHLFPCRPWLRAKERASKLPELVGGADAEVALKTEAQSDIGSVRRAFWTRLERHAEDAELGVTAGGHSNNWITPGKNKMSQRPDARAWELRTALDYPLIVARRDAPRPTLRRRRMLWGMLKAEGHEIGRPHVPTLMTKTGMEALCPRPRTMKPAPG